MTAVTTITGLGAGPASTLTRGAVFAFDPETGVTRHARHDEIAVGLNALSFGATGDGVTDDTAAIQDAIDTVGALGGGTIVFNPGTYLIARTAGVDDVWGVKITSNKIRLLAAGPGVVFARFTPDISTYAKAYPLLFVGTPDSNVAAAVEDVTIDGVEFQGSNTQHASPGSELHDFRNAIEVKNTRRLSVVGCRFTAIDSAVIFFQGPPVYNYVAARYYNTTKCYDAVMSGCRLEATAHATASRALIHAIACRGVDGLQVLGNTFSYCDVGVSQGSTYDSPEDTENDLWLPTFPGWALGQVKRTGRDLLISDNVFLNSSEHCVYLNGVDCAVRGNTMRVDVDALRTSDDPVKLRARNVVVANNTISGKPSGISINELSYNVTVQGNAICCEGIASGGPISIDSMGLSAYIAARPEYTGFPAMSNIVVADNVITQQEAANGNLQGNGIYISTDLVDANYPEGQLQSVLISGNTIRNARVGVFMYGSLNRQIVIRDNLFYAKPFTTAGFNGATVMETKAVLMVNRASQVTLREVAFVGNFVHGAATLVATHDGAGANVSLPRPMKDNVLTYIQAFKTADIDAVAVYQGFRNNHGWYFLDRTIFNGEVIENHLSVAKDANSFARQCFFWDNGANTMRFYSDDVGTFRSVVTT